MAAFFVGDRAEYCGLKLAHAANGSTAIGRALSLRRALLQRLHPVGDALLLHRVGGAYGRGG